MAIFGTIVLWGLAVLGFIALCAIVGEMISRSRDKPEIKTAPMPKPQPQVTNIRVVPQPAEPEQPQILQKTTMQITTTKYLDPNKDTMAVTDGR